MNAKGYTISGRMAGTCLLYEYIKTVCCICLFRCLRSEMTAQETGVSAVYSITDNRVDAHALRVDKDIIDVSDSVILYRRKSEICFDWLNSIQRALRACQRERVLIALSGFSLTRSVAATWQETGNLAGLRSARPNSHDRRPLLYLQLHRCIRGLNVQRLGLHGFSQPIKGLHLIEGSHFSAGNNLDGEINVESKVNAVSPFRPLEPQVTRIPGSLDSDKDALSPYQDKSLQASIHLKRHNTQRKRSLTRETQILQKHDVILRESRNLGEPIIH